MKIDFMGLGFARCGTTAIAKHLANHPEISMFSKKDTDYFTVMDSTNLYTEKYENTGIEGYWELLKIDKLDFTKVCGEFNPFLAHTKEAVDTIYKHFPNIKILLITRDPIERVHSHYSLHKLNNIPENNKDGKLEYPSNMDFMEFINSFPQHLEMGNYGKHIKYIKSKFKNVYITSLEDFKKCPKETMKGIYEFLGISNAFISNNLTEKINPLHIRKTNQKGVNLISRALNMTKAMGIPINHFRPFLNTTYNKIFKVKEVKKEKLIERDMKFLEEYYHTSIFSLEDYIKNDI